MYNHSLLKVMSHWQAVQPSSYSLIKVYEILSLVALLAAYNNYLISTILVYAPNEKYRISTTFTLF
jgi:hypothetical protein